MADKPLIQRSFGLTDDAYRDLKGSALACTVTNLSLMIPFVVTVAAFGCILDALTGRPLDANALWWLCGAGAVGLVAVFLAARHAARKTYLSAYTPSERGRRDLAAPLRKLPMSFFNRRGVSDVAESIMGDVTGLESMLSSTLPQLIAGCASTVIVCALLALFDWRLALCVVVTLPLAFGIVLGGRARERRLFERQNAARLEALAQVQEYVESIKDIRACRMVGPAAKGLAGALEALKRIAFKVELAVDVSVSSANTVLRAGIGLVVFAGVHLLTGGALSFTTLLMFLLIVSRVYGPIVSIAPQLPNLLNLSTKTARIQAVMAEPESTGRKEAAVESHRIEFDRVTFGYGERPVLREVSFTAEEGQVTALVGLSGSGKSTCAKLAARFWDPQEGAVRAGGADIRGFSEESWLSHMAIVFQDVVLFDDTVAENIRIGRADATDEEVREAARAAHCLEFVERLPQGFDTPLGENGAALSGGERQRLSIARALLKDAPVVLLDEATSALDPENETLVQEAIGALARGKTVLVIAHRLRTVAGAHKIVVLDAGAVAEQGTHDELLAAKGLYARLWSLQQQSLGWSL